MGYFLRDGRPVADPMVLVEIKSVNEAKVRVWEDCNRCCGKGHIPYYSHIAGGVCFACGDSKGWWKLKPCYSAEKLAKLVAAADKKADEKAAKIAAKKAAALSASIAKVGADLWADIDGWVNGLGLNANWDDAYDHNADVYDGLNKWDRIIIDLHGKAGAAVDGGLSDKAADFLKSLWANKVKFAAEKAAKDAEAVDVPAGRYEVKGKVLSIKEYHGDYGVVFKMLVDCGDYRVFGSVPASIRKEALAEDCILQMALVGKVVKFSGEFEPKEKGFGFFSRPSKAEMVKEEA